MSKNCQHCLSAGAIWTLQVRRMTRPESATTDTGYRGKLYQETNARSGILKTPFQEKVQSKR